MRGRSKIYPHRVEVVIQCDGLSCSQWLCNRPLFHAGDKPQSSQAIATDVCIPCYVYINTCMYCWYMVPDFHVAGCVVAMNVQVEKGISCVLMYVMICCAYFCSYYHSHGVKLLKKKTKVSSLVVASQLPGYVCISCCCVVTVVVSIGATACLASNAPSC